MKGEISEKVDSTEGWRLIRVVFWYRICCNWILVSCQLYRVTSALMRKPEGTGKKRSIPIRGVVYHLGFCRCKQCSQPHSGICLKARSPMFISAYNVINNTAVMPPPRHFRKIIHFTPRCFPLFSLFYITVLDCSRKLMSIKKLPDHGASTDELLAAWCYQHTARITRRDCVRKEQLHAVSIVDNTSVRCFRLQSDFRIEVSFRKQFKKWLWDVFWL